MCTTIRPTLLPFKELNDWDGAAEFVADYLSFDTLEPPYELVSNILFISCQLLYCLFLLIEQSFEFHVLNSCYMLISVIDKFGWSATMKTK